MGKIEKLAMKSFSKKSLQLTLYFKVVWLPREWISALGHSVLVFFS